MAAVAVALAAMAAPANALVSRQAQCCFSISASGGPGGSVGQISDGQTRIGQGLPASQFCLGSSGGSSGSITDSSGRGCILTAPTSQFQCDMGANAQGGFAVSGNGQLTHNGSPSFYACQITQGSQSYNLYTSPSGINCVPVTLTASNSNCASSGGASQASSVAASTPASPSAASPSVVNSQASSPASSSPAASSPIASSPAVSSPVASFPTQSVGSPKASSPVVVSTPQQQSQQTPKASSPVVASTPQQQTQQTQQTQKSEQTPVASTPVVVSTPQQQTQQTQKTEQTPKASSPVVASTPQQQTQQTQQSQETAKPSAAPAPSSPAASQPQLSPSAPAASPSVSQPQQSPSAPASAPSSSFSSCPANLQGNYQYPHLIVPVNSQSPTAAQGNSYSANISPTNTTIFNFDVPQSYAGQTCSLVFLLPQKGAVSTSDYTLSGSGQVDFAELSDVANQGTSYSNAPAVATDYGVQTVTAGSSLTVASFSCPPGQTVAYEAKSVGGTSLEYFQDYNAPGIGLYITAC